MLPPQGSPGIFRPISFNSCDKQLLSGCARAARQSFGNIGSKLTRKMAVTSSQSCVPWPNTKDDYELGKVIG